jgi:hypothetical protein
MKCKGCTLSKLLIYMLLTAEYSYYRFHVFYFIFKNILRVFFSPLNGLIFNVNITNGNVNFVL